MGKGKIVRKGAVVQKQDQIEAYREEELLVDSCPLPSAEELKRYQEIDPRLVDAFLKAWEEERKVRHEVVRGSVDLLQEKEQLLHKRIRLGMAFAFLSLLLFIGLAAFALYIGSPILAAVLGAFSVGAIVTTFINAHKSESKD